MRKVLILLFAVFCLHSVYADKSDKLNVYVSIMPQKFFAEKVALTLSGAATSKCSLSLA